MRFEHSYLRWVKIVKQYSNKYSATNDKWGTNIAESNVFVTGEIDFQHRNKTNPTHHRMNIWLLLHFYENMCIFISRDRFTNATPILTICYNRTNSYILTTKGTSRPHWNKICCINWNSRDVAFIGTQRYQQTNDREEMVNFIVMAYGLKAMKASGSVSVTHMAHQCQITSH